MSISTEEWRDSDVKIIATCSVYVRDQIVAYIYSFLKRVARRTFQQKWGTCNARGGSIVHLILVLRVRASAMGCF